MENIHLGKISSTLFSAAQNNLANQWTEAVDESRDMADVPRWNLLSNYKNNNGG